MAVGQDVHYNVVYTAMALRIRAIDHTLVVNQVCSREEVRASNLTAPKFLTNVFARFWEHLRNAPRLGDHTRYITPFSKVPTV